jgi:UDP-glucuronate decarboxylase
MYRQPIFLLVLLCWPYAEKPTQRVKMRILVTGGAGFLGSHLCEKLLSQGNVVLCLDNFTTGKKENLKDFITDQNFSVIEADLIDIPSIPGKIDQIYNLACPASPVQYQKNPIGTLKTNVIGAINVLDLGLEKGARVLQASTSEVYGDPEIHPQSEDYLGNVNPIGIRSCYDEGKRAAETAFFDYHRSSDLDIRVVRIFNTYGPRMDPDDGRVISNFIMQALNDKAVTIYGSGKQTRSFCYVEDLIRGLVLAMNAEKIGPGPFNLGNPQEFDMLEIAEKIIEITKSESKISFKPLPQDDPRKRKPDITKIKSKVNWDPLIEINDGLFWTIQYFRNELKKTGTSNESH